MEQKFEMVAKTMKGLEMVLAEELRNLGAENVEPGRRMVSFYGDLEMLYKANLCCRTALRILKPFYKFEAHDPDTLYDMVKEYDWSTLLSPERTFSIDTVVNSEGFSNSRFVVYKVKDAIVDWFRDRYGDGKRPSVRLKDADIMINVHITDDDVTLSLDSSGESLHKRGYRVAQTEAPINEVLAAGIILMSGWRGEVPFVDPMCGSGTFLIEAALIAANINPGVYRQSFAFETWPDFDRDLFDRLYDDESGERDVTCTIYGADISPRAIEIATQNIKQAGLAQYITLSQRPISQWESAPQPAGVLVTNPPYGERISAPNMEGLYSTIGTVLKNVFTGYHAWIIGYRDEYFRCISLAPSQKIELLNGSLECQLREYVMFQGDKKSFLAAGGKLKNFEEEDDEAPRRQRKDGDHPRRRFEDRGGRPKRKFDDRDDHPKRKFDDRDDRPKRKFDDRDDRPKRKFDDRDDRPKRKFDDRDDRPKRKFDDRDDRPKRRFDDREDRPKRRFDDREDRPKRRYEDREERQPQETPENPLALRRNPAALKALSGRKPQLPPNPDAAPKMRQRGWRKKDS